MTMSIPHIQLILMSFMHYFTLLIDIWFEESRNINSIKMLFLFFLRNITVAIIAEKIINLTVTDVDKGLCIFSAMLASILHLWTNIKSTLFFIYVSCF